MILVPQSPVALKASQPTKPAPTSSKYPKPVQIQPSHHKDNPADSPNDAISRSGQTLAFKGALLSKPVFESPQARIQGFLEKMTNGRLRGLYAFFTDVRRSLMMTLGLQSSLHQHAETFSDGSQEAEASPPEEPDEMTLPDLQHCHVPGAYPSAIKPEPLPDEESAPSSTSIKAAPLPPSNDLQQEGSQEKDALSTASSKPGPVVNQEPEPLSPTHQAEKQPEEASGQSADSEAFPEDFEVLGINSAATSLASSIELVELPESPKPRDLNDLEAGWALVEDDSLWAEPPVKNGKQAQQSSKALPYPHRKPSLDQRINRFILKRMDQSKL
ncbi:MAG: hypothetical protein K0Q50_2600 [Vampirovibrio sp.]|nr:hypothetical protein [Vampirovibrio sp.]